MWELSVVAGIGQPDVALEHRMAVRIWFILFLIFSSHTESVWPNNEIAAAAYVHVCNRNPTSSESKRIFAMHIVALKLWE